MAHKHIRAMQLSCFMLLLSVRPAFKTNYETEEVFQGERTCASLAAPGFNMSHDVHIHTGCVWVDDSAGLEHHINGAIVIHAGASLIFKDIADLSLSVTNIEVFGTLQMGISSSPLISSNITITLRGGSDHGVYAEHAMHSKGIHAEGGGTIDIHGKPLDFTWSRLQATANSGDASITLQDDVNWEPGQEIVVVTTTAIDERENHQNEVRIIQAISGTTITLDRPLTFSHYAGPEYQGEVALLSRSITVQGDEDSYRHNFGGHIMCMLGSSCRFSSVRAFRMGQKNVMGRYPFHFHLMGALNQESYARGVTVQNSFFRAFTLHAVSNMTISDSVAFNITGNAVYLEDGVEEHNLLARNLVAHVHPIAGFTSFIKGPKVQSWRDSGVEPLPDAGIWYTPVPERVMPADLFAAPFYCLNPNNRWVGNVASGGWTGFIFPSVPAPLGLTGKEKPELANYFPTNRSILEFDGNTAHSSGHLWDFGSCIYFGGAMNNENPSNASHYMYNPARDSGEYFRPHFVLNNTLTYACRIGLVVWGTTDYVKPQVTVSGHRSYDSLLGFRLLAHSAVVGTTFGSHTQNNHAFGTAFVWDPRDFGADPGSNGTQGGVMGLSFYDTLLQTLVSNSTCKGFVRDLDFCFMNPQLYLSQFPTGQSALSHIRFENTLPSHRLKLSRGGSAATFCHSSQYANVVDSDGSLTDSSAGVILGATDPSVTECKSMNWWLLDDEAICQKSFTEWAGGYWSCPLKLTTSQQRLVVSILLMKGDIFTGKKETALFMGQPVYKKASSMIVKKRANLIEGFLYHFGHSDRKSQLGNAPYDKDSAWQVTGACCDIGWYLDVSGGTPDVLTISLEQMGSGGLIFATRYGPGYKPRIDRFYFFGATYQESEKLTKTTSKTTFLASSGNLFYLETDGDGTTLFLKLVNEKASMFESGGNRQTANKFWGAARYVLRNKGTSSSSAFPGNIPGADWIPHDYSW